jgi:hypothetical protein
MCYDKFKVTSLGIKSLENCNNNVILLSEGNFILGQKNTGVINITL